MMPKIPTFSEGAIGSKIIDKIMKNPKIGCQFYPELLISFDQDINEWKRDHSWDSLIKKGYNSEGEISYYLDDSFLIDFDFYSAISETVVGLGEICKVNTRKCDTCTNDILGMQIFEGEVCYCDDNINPFNDDIIADKDAEFNVPPEVEHRFHRYAPLTKKQFAIANYLLSGIPDVSLQKISEFAEKYEELPEKKQLIY